MPIKLTRYEYITQYVSAGPARLRVRVTGDGPTLVLLPGLGRPATDLDPLAALLAAGGCRVVQPDPRGSGDSTGPMEGLTLHDLAADVSAVIETVGVARRRSSARRSAIGLRGRPRPTGGILCARWCCWDAAARSSRRPRSRGRSGWPRRSTRRPISAPAPFAPLGMARGAISRFGSTAGRSRSCRLTWPPLPPPTPHPGGPPATAQVLIVQGAEDVSAPPANGHLLKAEIGERAMLVDLPGIGHAVGVEGPDAVARVVLRYLAGEPVVDAA